MESASPRLGQVPGRRWLSVSLLKILINIIFEGEVISILYINIDTLLLTVSIYCHLLRNVLGVMQTFAQLNTLYL